jgi:hypothetical protein
VRTLTRRELNRALLARQLLLERAPLALPQALERVCGIQAQYAPSMYFGLWSRLDGFEPAALTAALHAREVVQATLMRVTIHLVSARDLRPMAAAVREARRALWLRSWKEPGAEAMADAARMLAERLREGPLPRREVEALIGKEEARAVGLWVDLVRVPPSGTWERRRADLYGLAEDWVGPPDVDEREAVDHLVRRYLEAFGPAAKRDAAAWSGVAQLDFAWDRVRTVSYRDEKGRELLDLPGRPLPPADTPLPPRFVGSWDQALLAYADRDRIIPPEILPLQLTLSGAQTVLVDGRVAASWTIEDGRMVITPHADFPKEPVREEALRTARFLEARPEVVFSA